MFIICVVYNADIEKYSLLENRVTVLIANDDIVGWLLILGSNLH